MRKREQNNSRKQYPRQSILSSILKGFLLKKRLFCGIQNLLSLVCHSRSSRESAEVSIPQQLQDPRIKPEDDRKKILRRLSSLFTRSSYSGNKKTDAKIEQKIDELKTEARKIAAIDQEIIRLQQSTKTSFRSMNKIHVYLCMRNKAYHNLHTLKYVTPFNFSALIIFFLSFSFSISANYTRILGPVLPKGISPVASIHASEPEDPSLYTGENKGLKVGFSNKETKTVGATVTSKSDRIPNAGNYQLSMNLLSDGLSIPAEKTLGYVKSNNKKDVISTHSEVSKARNLPINVSGRSLDSQTTRTRDDDFLGIGSAKAQDSQPQATNYQPPATSVVSDKIIQGDNTVIYRITNKISARYVMEETKVKEYITIGDKEALRRNQLFFNLDSQGLYYKEAYEKDGSYLAVTEEFKDKPAEKSSWVFRILKPTIEDKNKQKGTISLEIKDGKAIYTIDQHFLDNAQYPIIIDPPIASSGVTCTWTDASGDGLYGTAANWSCSDATNHVPTNTGSAGDAAVFDSTSYDTAIAASDSVPDNIYSLTVNGKDWGGGGNFITAAAVDTTNHFIYYGTNESPARVIKVNSQTNKFVDMITLNAGEKYLFGSGVIDIARGYLYFGMATINSPVVKIDINPAHAFARVGAYPGTSGENHLRFGAISSDGAYLYFVTTYGGSPKVIQIQTSDMTKVGSTLTLSLVSSTPSCVATDGTNVYFCSGTKVDKISMTNPPVEVAAFTATSGEATFYSGTASGGFGFFADASSPSKVTKVDLSTMNQSGTTKTLNTNENKCITAVNDGTYAYFTTWTSPSRIIKFDMANDSRFGSIQLNVNESYIMSGAIDGTTAYFATPGVPALSVKVDLSGFTRSGATGFGSALFLNPHPTTGSDHYIWNMNTINVASSSVVAAGDSNVNTNPIPAGCSSGTKCGRGIEFVTGGDMTIGTTGSLNADYAGFGGNSGPGGGNYQGGSHIGMGGSTVTYDSVAAPMGLGSGGYSDIGFGAESFNAPGGGAIKLTTSGTVTINGKISANGRSPGGDTPNNSGSGGAGGSIFINTPTLLGNGSVTVNGGSTIGFGQGGGGGLISIVLTSGTSYGSVAFNAFGSTSGAAAGTIYKKNPNQTNGSLVVDNNGLTTGDNETTKLVSGASYVFDDITLNNKANLEIGDNTNLDLRPTTIAGDGTGYLSHRGSGVLQTGTSLILSSWNLIEETSAIGNVTDLTINSGAVLTHAANTSTETHKMNNLTLNNLTINNGGKVDVSNKGYAKSYGVGKGTAGNAGGGYGGTGGDTGGGIPYGSADMPVNIGSGGAAGNCGGAGGGAIRLTINGTLTNNNIISANGEATGICGGGSGGSVFIVTNNLSGGGTITANGGSKGGGGRVAVYIYGTDTFTATNITANSGGAGTPAATAGTKVVQHFPLATVDNFVGQYQHKLTTIKFHATDGTGSASNSDGVNGDYWRAKLDVSTDSGFAAGQTCTFTQTAASQTGSSGSGCAGLAGTFEADPSHAADYYNSNSYKASSGQTAYGQFRFTQELPQITSVSQLLILRALQEYLDRRVSHSMGMITLRFLRLPRQ